MGRINKYANIYDKNGNLMRHIDDSGTLKSYTIEELEQLVDKLATDKDENGKIKDPQALNNANSVLFVMYNKHPERLKQLVESLHNKGVEKTTEEQVKQAMDTLTQELEAEEQSKQEPEMDKYIDFQEVKDDE